jgi:hypothetical protein
MNNYKINKKEITEINDINFTNLCGLIVLNACLSFEIATTFILKLIIAYIFICGPGQIG